MKIKLNIQKNGQDLIKDRLIKESESKPKRVYFYVGNVKETGFDILEECLIDLKARKLIVMGIDKKNTTKKMLDTLCNYTKNVYVFNNNGLSEFDSNIWIFEYESKAKVYVMNSNTSEGAFVDNIATYNEIEYDLENKLDVGSYKEYIENLISIPKFDTAIKLDKDVIKELFDSNQIFTTKQYTHNVMTISELLGDKKESDTKKSENINEDIIIEKENDSEKNIVNIPKVDLSDIEDFNIDIDIDESIKREDEIIEKASEVKNISKKSEEKKTKDTKKDDVAVGEEFDRIDFDEDSVLDIENLLFEKSDIELDKMTIKKKLSKEKTDEEKTASKKVDLTKVSNLIMELPKKPTKGKDVSVIKIPNYVKNMIPEFFSVVTKYKTVEKAGATFRETKIKLEIVDIRANEKYSDLNAKIILKTGQTYITFVSDYLENVEYDEDDIIRIIKLSNDTYHMEIVPKDVQEYNIWKKLCTNNFKSSTRSYGVM